MQLETFLAKIDNGESKELHKVVENARSNLQTLDSLEMAKSAKVIRDLIDACLAVKDSNDDVKV